MCGIAGIISTSLDQVSEGLQKAELVQLHRGPDCQDSNILQSGNFHVGLNHQRLSIIDLSNAGKQPMYSSSKDSLIAYNGEVYNYKELRSDLSIHLKTNTDTEVVLEMLEKHGLKASLNSFNGMWAFSWLDINNKKLYLARDRAGIKPLYYSIQSDGSLIFASEIKAVLAASNDKYALNHQVIGEYICQSQQDTTTNTFFEGINSIPAGHYAEIDLSSDKLDVNTFKYWDVFDNPSTLSFDEAKKRAKELFHDSVKLRMRSDVPIGVTLSGGLDSSAIAVKMKSLLSEGQTLNVLSAVSPDSKQDESEFIDIMGDHLKCVVHKVSLGWEPEEAIKLMRKVTWHNDTPLGSFSNIAHYLLMKKANDIGITVILSGQGADELLCGYKKYLGFTLQDHLRNHRYTKFLTLGASFFANRSILNQFNFQEAKRYLPSRFTKKDTDIRGSALLNYKPVSLGLQKHQSLQQRQAHDLSKYSVPFLTHYEDRMSMAWAKEIRLPFLDYRLMELFINLPTHYKLDKGWTKYIFRKAMEKDLPKEICWRKDKQGFVSPQESWLRHELKEEVLSIFNDDALIFKYNLVNKSLLLEKYKAFCTQKDNKGAVWYREIFNPLALEIWLQTFQEYIQYNA